jgi:hypothetical protein
MQKAQEVIKQQQDKSSAAAELVTVEGLKFKKHQMEIIRLMAQIYNNNNVNEFLTDTIITRLLMKMRGMNTIQERDQLAKDDYEEKMKKVMVLTGVPAEVLRDNLKTGTQYELSDQSVASMSVVGIWTRTVEKVTD